MEQRGFDEWFAAMLGASTSLFEKELLQKSREQLRMGWSLHQLETNQEEDVIWDRLESFRHGGML